VVHEVVCQSAVTDDLKYCHRLGAFEQEEFACHTLRSTGSLEDYYQTSLTLPRHRQVPFPSFLAL
jgi:hypothetical protein